MPASPAAHPKITNHPASAAFRHPRGVQKQALSLFFNLLGCDLGVSCAFWQ
jgi:hypothetical protein